MTTALAVVVPTAVQQKLMLLAALVLAGVGVAVLLRRHGVAATTCGAALAVWNPYGRTTTWSAAADAARLRRRAWIVVAMRRRTTAPRRLALVVLAALPRALTPFGELAAAARSRSGQHSSPGAPLEGLTLTASTWPHWVRPCLARSCRSARLPCDRDGACRLRRGCGLALGTVGSVLMLSESLRPARCRRPAQDLLRWWPRSTLLLLTGAEDVALVGARGSSSAIQLGLLYVGPAGLVLMLDQSRACRVSGSAALPGVAIYTKPAAARLSPALASTLAAGLAVAAGRSASHPAPAAAPRVAR